MATYKVRSGQNLYDVALTLYGSVEGIFDLLASNRELSMNTQLHYGMELEYHEEFAINKDIVTWLNSRGIVVKNGEHVYVPLDINHIMEEHIRTEHPDIHASIGFLSSDEQNIFWEELTAPRMIICQYGQLTSVTLRLKAESHLVIDWGDYSAPVLIDSTQEQEIEHVYKGTGRHLVTLYGNFALELLDLKKINGIHYPLSSIVVDTFITAIKNEELQKLIIHQ